MIDTNKCPVNKLFRFFSSFLVLLFCAVSHASAQTDLDEALMNRRITKTEQVDLTDSSKIEIAEPSRAIVNISGVSELPQTKWKRQHIDMHAWMEVFDGNGNYFKKRVLLNAQGNSSMSLDKKNFAVDFCEDEWIGDQTTEMTIGNWVDQDSYHFKAFYTDYFKGIGEIGYKLYSQTQRDRKPFWERVGLDYGKSKAKCVPDGFPCEVYLNGKFYGIFVWQLKKHRKNMNMTKNLAEHIHLDGDIRQDFILGGNINWTKFEIRNPKGLYCVDTEEVSGYEYKKISDTELIATIEGTCPVVTDKPSDWTNEQIVDLYGSTPPQYLYYEKKGNYYELKVLSGVTYCKYDGEKPQELIDENMPYFDPNNKDHVLTAQVKAYIIQMSNYYNEVKSLIDAGATTEDIRAAFEQRFDIDSFLDYYVNFMVLANGDGSRKNWQWFTYNGTKWHVAPYDLDQIMGEAVSTLMPADYSMNTSTLIPFDILNKYYKEDYINRYKVLRENGVITETNLKSLIDNWYNRVGETNYAREKDTWPDAVCYNDIECNPNWKAITNYNTQDYYKLTEYSDLITYNAGERCKSNFVIFECQGTSTGVTPYKKLSYQDSLERIHDWIDSRIPYLDRRFGLTSEVQPIESYSLTISSAGWATICLPFEFEVPNGLTAYSVVGIEEGKNVPTLCKEETWACNAYKPYLIKGKPGTYLITGVIGDEPDPYSYDYLRNGWLTGTLSTMNVPTGSYVLQNQNGRIGFYYVPGNKTMSIAANRAYLSIQNGNQVKMQAFYIEDDENTDILYHTNESSSVSDIYNIAGVKVTNLQNGIHIIRMSDGHTIKKVVK